MSGSVPQEQKFGYPAGMASLLTTAADVGAALDRTDEVIQGLDAVISSCAGITSATQAQWTAFKTSWVDFVVETESQIYHVPLTGQAFATFNPYSAMTSVEGFQASVAQWQAIAAASCGAHGPSVQLPVEPDPAWLVGLKWAGGLVVAGAVIFALAPVIETVVESSAVARSAASTKRLYQKARSKRQAA
jgi:hypothetical protein